MAGVDEETKLFTLPRVACENDEFRGRACRWVFERCLKTLTRNCSRLREQFHVDAIDWSEDGALKPRGFNENGEIESYVPLEPRGSNGLGICGKLLAQRVLEIRTITTFQ